MDILDFNSFSDYKKIEIVNNFNRENRILFINNQKKFIKDNSDKLNRDLSSIIKKRI